jgi:molybdopterin-containing oxidoreductase family membrane subunit
MAINTLDRPASKLEKIPVLGPEQTPATVTDKIASIVLGKRTPLPWYAGALFFFLILNMMMAVMTWLVAKGIGIWGPNQPVGWGFDIINFVWWIGIGHAGTLISAILHLLKQNWRNSINRFAEAMTIFAVMCAGLYPLFHTGRPWLAHFLLPIGPNTYGMWPNFRSPLVWDVFAVSTYFTVSLLFWIVGMIPDFATLRDKAGNKVFRFVYGILAMGWRGSAKHWARYDIAYLLLAGLSTPLVLSVHSIVSFDFAVGIVPGWHSTIFPPYFVAGAIYAGFAMVLFCVIPLRKAYGLEDLITLRHIDNMAKVMLATGLIVGYGYLVEVFFGWYSANTYEWYMTVNRMIGPYWWSYWLLIITNVAIPQLLWIKKWRMHLPMLFFITIVISIGMWLERFVIIVVSLHRDFLPSSWGMYSPTIYDWGMFVGTLGMFFFFLFLFVRFLPTINMAEMRHLAAHKEHGGHASHDTQEKAEAH